MMKIVPVLLVVLAMPSEHRLLAQESATLDQVYNTFSEAYRQLDASMIQHLYEDSAYYMYPQIPLQKGHDNFMPGFRDMFRRAQADSVLLEIQFRIVERQMMAPYAYDVGYYKLTHSNGKHSVGKFVTILKKQPDSSWKFVLDSYSSAPDEAF